MSTDEVKELARRFAGNSMHIDEFVDIVTHHFDISRADARKLIIDTLPTGRSMVFL